MLGNLGLILIHSKRSMSSSNLELAYYTHTYNLIVHDYTLFLIMVQWLVPMIMSLKFKGQLQCQKKFAHMKAYW